MRYYSTQRPIVPGSYPCYYDVKSIHNFEHKTFCEDIGREAWGYIDYAVCIPEEDAEKWELTMAGKKLYWGVTTAVYDDGRSVARITNTVEAVCKPESIFRSTSRKDIYVDWFDSRDAAIQFREEAKHDQKNRR